MNMVITNQQEAEKFVLSYLEKHQEFLKIVFQKFSLPKKTRKKKLELVDAETNARIGQALAEHKAGLGTILSTEKEIDEYFDRLDKEAEEEMCIN